LSSRDAAAAWATKSPSNHRRNHDGELGQLFSRHGDTAATLERNLLSLRCCCRIDCSPGSELLLETSFQAASIIRLTLVCRPPRASSTPPLRASPASLGSSKAAARSNPGSQSDNYLVTSVSARCILLCQSKRALLRATGNDARRSKSGSK